MGGGTAQEGRAGCSRGACCICVHVHIRCTQHWEMSSTSRCPQQRTGAALRCAADEACCQRAAPITRAAAMMLVTLLGAAKNKERRC